MKKIIIALLAALLLLSACQPTPEAAVVVQKDFGQLTEKAKLDESHVPDLLLSESLKAPKTLHKALENREMLKYILKRMLPCRMQRGCP